MAVMDVADVDVLVLQLEWDRGRFHSDEHRHKFLKATLEELAGYLIEEGSDEPSREEAEQAALAAWLFDWLAHNSRVRFGKSSLIQTIVTVLPGVKDAVDAAGIAVASIGAVRKAIDVIRGRKDRGAVAERVQRRLGGEVIERQFEWRTEKYGPGGNLEAVEYGPGWERTTDLLGGIG